MATTKKLDELASTKKATASGSVAATGSTATYTGSTADNYETGRPEYDESSELEKLKKSYAAYQKNKPGEYTSQYADQIQALLDKTLNREKFSYDVGSDPLYQQYMQNAQVAGKQAMRGAMGEAAALTGGYGSSYAQNVGQQTYQQSLDSANEMIPSLYTAASEAYQNEGADMDSDLALLMEMDDKDYGVYRDNVTDYQTELQFLYNQVQDLSDDDYNRYLNDVSAWESDRAYWYQKAQDDYAKSVAAASSSSGRSGRSSGSGGSSGTDTVNMPTTYSEAVALTGNSGIMTNMEFARRNHGQNYQDYLKKMVAKYT